jgi:hypothetical protein
MKAVLNKADGGGEWRCVLSLAQMLLCCCSALFVTHSADVFTYLGLWRWRCGMQGMYTSRIRHPSAIMP